MARVTMMELEQTEDHAAERPRPKVGRIPVTLRLLNEEENTDIQVIENRKSDTQFMMLLVTLFIIVNVTLVALLNHKDKEAAVAPVVAAEHHDVSPVVITAPVAPAAPIVKSELPALALHPVIANTSRPAAAPAAVQPGYVTPANSATSRATSAPYQRVTVSEHSVPTSATLQDNLTIVHTQNPPPPVAVSPELAPAAGTPAAVQSPEAAKQDLLSVINKD